MSDRRASYHQTVIGASLTPSSGTLQARIQATALYLQQHGFPHADALNAAYAQMYEQLGAQTRLMAFMDCFYVLGLMTLVAAPLMLLTRNFRVSGKASAAH